MKNKLLTLTALLIALSLSGQTRIAINQDAKLAFYGDDKGNESYTPNLTFRFSQAFVKGKILNPITVIEYEIADLQGGLYSRMGIGIGFNIPTILKHSEMQFHMSAGFINRNGRSYANSEMVGNMSFAITDKVSLILEAQRTVRTDLYGQPIIFSGKIGLRFEIFNKPVFKD